MRIGPVINLIILVLIVVLEIFYISVVGIQSIPRILGWATVLLLVLPGIVFISWGHSKYLKWKILLQMIVLGLLSINHLSYYLFVNLTAVTINPLNLYLPIQPYAVIIIPFLILYDDLLKKRYSSETEKILIMSVRFLPAFSIVLTMYVGIFFLGFRSHLYDSINVLMFSMCISLVVVFYFVRRLSYSQIEYILKPINRMNHDDIHLKPIFVGINLLVILSLFLEYNRGFWVLAVLSIFGFLLMQLILKRIFMHLFFDDNEKFKSYDDLPVPKIWSKKYAKIYLATSIIILPITYVVINIVFF